MNSPFRHIKGSNYGWLLLVSVAFVCPIFLIGLPVGSLDLFHHMTIANAWAQAFQNGSFIPDWVYVENNGYGAVNVRFYPPLIHITLAVSKLAFRSWGHAIFAAFLFWSFIGNLGVFLWTRDVVDSRKAALAAAAIFVFTPYHVNQFYHGFFWGEFVSLSVAPFCFYFVRRMQQNPNLPNCLGLSLCFALLILSNIPQLIVIAICLGVYFLLLVDRQTILRSFCYVAVAAATSLALTSFFWIRLIAEIHWIKIGQPGIDPLYDYRNNFLLTELRLTEGLNDLVMMFFGTYFLIVMVALVIVAIAVSGRFASLRINRQYRAVTLVFLISSFLTSFTSQFVWDILPLLHRIQFPWRFLSIASLCFAVLMGLSLNSINLDAWRERRPAVLVLSGLVLILLTFSIKQDILAATYIDHASFETEVVQSFERVGLEHWHPTWTTTATFSGDASLSVGGRETAVHQWNENGHEFSVGPGPIATAKAPIAYYPHWQVLINDAPAQTFEADGLLTFDIPEEESNVKMKFVEPTYSIASRWVSLVASILFLCVIALMIRKTISREELLA